MKKAGLKSKNLLSKRCLLLTAIIVYGIRVLVVLVYGIYALYYTHPILNSFTLNPFQAKDWIGVTNLMCAQSITRQLRRRRSFCGSRRDWGRHDLDRCPRRIS